MLSIGLCMSLVVLVLMIYVICCVHCFVWWWWCWDCCRARPAFVSCYVQSMLCSVDNVLSVVI